jgi:hypothetical protein
MKHGRLFVQYKEFTYTSLLQSRGGVSAKLEEEFGRLLAALHKEANDKGLELEEDKILIDLRVMAPAPKEG